VIIPLKIYLQMQVNRVIIAILSQTSKYFAVFEQFEPQCISANACQLGDYCTFIANFKIFCSIQTIAHVFLQMNTSNYFQTSFVMVIGDCIECQIVL